MQIVDDISRSLGLKNVRILKTRAEECRETFDFMLGRAVSAVPNFLSFSSHFLSGTSSNEKSGLLYIKGGDFTEELKNAFITSYKIYPINNLTTLDTDKTVLYIPAKEILAFNCRKVDDTSNLQVSIMLSGNKPKKDKSIKNTGQLSS
jgi:16S rRNA (guanine527-N7)-methyltransferase